MSLLDLGVTQNLSQHEYLIQIHKKIWPWFPRDNSKCQKCCPNAVFWGWTSLFLISRSRHVFTNLPNTNLQFFYQYFPVEKEKKNVLLKSVHFKKTVARKSRFFQNCSTFNTKQFWKKRDSRNCLLKMNGQGIFSPFWEFEEIK